MLKPKLFWALKAGEKPILAAKKLTLVLIRMYDSGFKKWPDIVHNNEGSQMEYIRVITIRDGRDVHDTAMPMDSATLATIVATFKNAHNANEVAGDETYVHYLSADGSSFLGVYHVQKFHK